MLQIFTRSSFFMMFFPPQRSLCASPLAPTANPSIAIPGIPEYSENNLLDCNLQYSMLPQYPGQPKLQYGNNFSALAY